MHSGYWLLATLFLPLIVAAVLVAVPDDRKDVVRWISVTTGGALFALSFYVFFAYEVDHGGGYQFFIRYDWLENVAFLGPHGISLALGIDGIAAPMVLLTGIVAFGGALISWKIEEHNKDFFILFLGAGLGNMRLSNSNLRLNVPAQTFFRCCVAQPSTSLRATLRAG